MISNNSSYKSDVVTFSQELARWLHRGQVDKQGKPIFDHVCRVHDRLNNLNPKPSYYVLSAAYLHDTVEDCNITPLWLVGLGLPERVAYLVMLLSRGKNESYLIDYIPRISMYRDATLIKLSDLSDNLDPVRVAACRAAIGESVTEKLTERYLVARGFLTSIYSDLPVW